MNQPNLGKKIVELRKAKGLTQDELAEKCNISIRTIQRIEAGEVYPRSYTVKLIFTALDFNIYNSTEIKTAWLEQFYRYTFELFNLKTNTMKKVSIFTILLTTIVISVLAITKESKAQKENNDNIPVSGIDSSNNVSHNDLVFSHFSCESCFDDNDEIIGQNVQFKVNGVMVKMGLIKINKTRREFTAGYVTGKLFDNKVELTVPKDILNDDGIKLSADKIERLDDRILLKGSAKLTSIEKDLIEANEIIILFK